MLSKNAYKIELKKEIFTYELGEKISANVTVFLKDDNSTKNTIKYKISSDTLQIENNNFIKSDYDNIPVGEYEVKIKYKNKSKNFKIKVIDTVSPEFIDFKDMIEIEQTTENIDLTEYFQVKDLSTIKLNIKNDYNLTEPNDYSLEVIAEDESGNISSKTFVLKVIKKPEPIVSKKEEKKSNSPSTNNKTQESLSNTSATNNIEISKIQYRKDISNLYISQINSYRTSNGLSQLSVTSEAQNEADRRAKEISINYSHDESGYGFGEIIGTGNAGGDFITAWKNSPSHNATMLREENTAMAASVYEVNGTWYAVVVFRMNY